MEPAAAPINIIQLHPQDNVAVACHALSSGDYLEAQGLKVASAVPAGHKLATKTIAKGEAIRKYGQIIGFAGADISAGEHVHIHNVVLHDFARDYAIGHDVKPTAFQLEKETFLGYRRANGSIGTRNYIGILTTVNCAASVARNIAEQVQQRGLLAAHSNIDGVVALTHGTGCGMSNSDDGFLMLQRTIWGYARHPNFAGILILGLGCEVNQIRYLVDAYQIAEGTDCRVLNIQDTGGTAKTVDHACRYLQDMLRHASQHRRESVPASSLRVGLQCGGSDGNSGITANPALGVAADLLVQHGGTAILSETPEIYGAEHLLTRRAISEKVARKLINCIQWWEDYTARHGGKMDNNPSPGNKAGGLTTILEKSLGAVAKAGSTNLIDVYQYAQPITQSGLVFMDSPGYDPVSVTGQIASGANLICFTTGRGSVSGFKPVPCIKIASNTPMYLRIVEDMDINCGGILDGSRTVAQCGQEIFELMLRVASGEATKSEAQNFGDFEFVPWQIGAVM